MELRALRNFLAIVDYGTVSSAARALCLAQPALSRQLAALEREAGVVLFERSGGRLQLTAAGRVLAAHARDLVEHADRVDTTIRNLAAGRAGQLIVAAPEATVSELIAPFVATLGPQDPLVLVRECPALEPPDQLLGVADFVVSLAPVAGSWRTELVGTVPVRAYVPAGHRLTTLDARTVSLEVLVAEPLVVQTRANMSRVLLDSAVSQRGLTYRAVAESDLELVVQALAASGRGVGVLTQVPRFGLQPLRIIDEERGPIGVELRAAWPSDHYASAVIAGLAGRLRPFLTAVLQSFDPGAPPPFHPADAQRRAAPC